VAEEAIVGVQAQRSSEGRQCSSNKWELTDCFKRTCGIARPVKNNDDLKNRS
jgi:hypothetical protein